MPQWFTDVANAADTGEKSATRALQAWQYLIAKASNRQIARYDDLRELMEYTDNRPLTSALSCLMWYCEQNALPPLTIIVVNQSGVPGPGFTAARLEDYHRSREDVFNYPWYRMVPPTVAELREAYVTGYHAAPRTATQPSEAEFASVQ
ncbi:MAG: hypothetical protein L0219_22785 [Phycisphaerales bacterium]|nr:hypothetical protein [Phycisphaerales bacterium]